MYRVVFIIDGHYGERDFETRSAAMKVFTALQGKLTEKNYVYVGQADGYLRYQNKQEKINAQLGVFNAPTKEKQGFGFGKAFSKNR